MDNNRFGETLRELRIQKNMNQKQVALELNVTPQTYSNYERGKRFPGPDMLRRIAQYYQVSTDQLLITGLHPQPADPLSSLTPEDQEMMRAYHRLTPDKQKQVKDYILFLEKRP